MQSLPDSFDKVFGLLKLGYLAIERDQLLTFGACETAAGNELAALGLAGVAVKTGAKSAVGTLWKVPEKSTAQLMATFFRELCDNPTLSKAKALQTAQEWLLVEYRAYPFHWAPFLLIGNWF